MVRQQRFRLSVVITVLLLGLFVIALPLSGFAQSVLTSGLKYNDKGQPIAVVVSGKITEPSECYLGVSIYKTGVTDALSQGDHRFETVPAGQNFTKEFLLNGLNAGTYEVGLWSKKIPKNLAEDKDNFFVKKWGFYFDGSKSYASGWIMPLTPAAGSVK